MFRTAARSTLRAARRFQSTETKAESFTNKYNFNLDPPPVHSYWNARNSLVLFAFVPAFIGAGYLGIYVGSNLSGMEGLTEFADSEQSPLKTLKFGESQKK